MLTDCELLSIFSLVGPIEYPEVPGSDVQIVLASTCASFKERRWPLAAALGSARRQERGLGEAGLFQYGPGRSRTLTTVNAQAVPRVVPKKTENV